MLLGNANWGISEPWEAIIVQRSGKEGWKIPKVKAKSRDINKGHIHSSLKWMEWQILCHTHRTLHTCHCTKQVKRNLCLRSHKHEADVWVRIYMFTHLLFTHSSSQTIHQTPCVPGSSATRNTNSVAGQTTSDVALRTLCGTVIKKKKSPKTKTHYISYNKAM